MASHNPIAFLKQSFKNFRTVGALAPSSRFLARAIAGSLPRPLAPGYRVLEVGPGTGAITRELAKAFEFHGTLDLYEISAEFCDLLRRLKSVDPMFLAMGERLQIHQGDVRALAPQPQYDTIISGLPFNNFEPAEVEGFLRHFQALLKPGGMLTWFEYVAIRRLQAPFVSRARRARLKGISDVTGGFVRAHQVRQQIIPINFPPARVRHLCFAER